LATPGYSSSIAYANGSPKYPNPDPIRNLKSQNRELWAKKDAKKIEIEILKGFGDKMGDTSLPAKPTASLTPFSRRLLLVPSQWLLWVIRLRKLSEILTKLNPRRLIQRS